MDPNGKLFLRKIRSSEERGGESRAGKSEQTDWIRLELEE